MSENSRSHELFVQADGVLSQEVEGELVLFDADREQYYTLDPTATRMWQLLTAHGNCDAVVSQMLTEFDVDEAVLRSDLADLVARLSAAGLVVTSSRA